MRKLFLALIIASFQGCIYGDVAMPLDTDLNQTRLGDKVGRASSRSVMWLFAWGDASTAKAASNGGIKVINHLDREVEFVFFGLYTRSTTVAYGD